MHIGLCCPAASGHLNPTTTLGRELQRRGHRVSLICVADAEAKARAAGLDYLPIGLAEAPVGSTARQYEALGKLSGGRALRFTVQMLSEFTKLWIRDTPAAIRYGNITGLVVDQFAPAAATAAEYLGVPYVTICNALPIHREPAIPPLNLAWQYRDSAPARFRNRLGYFLLDRVASPVRRTLNAQRRAWNLAPLSDPLCDSQLAQIAQLPSCLDYPRKFLPPHFHYTGPFHDDRSGDTTAFPFDQLTGQPVIYASMGTLQNRLRHVFQTIAGACEGLDAQLVISLGSKDQRIPTDLAGSPLVVSYAPQVELLKRAAMVITHAGMNTALETLAQGLPMVAIPITNDQPGVAARLVYTGVGEMAPLSTLRAESLREAVERVLIRPIYREKARKLQTEMAKIEGVHAAADIILQALSSSQPVLRNPQPAGAANHRHGDVQWHG